MPTEVDLSKLARSPERAPRLTSAGRRHLFTRLVLPGVLALGFLALGAWGARDVVFPPVPVTVVPVHVTQSASHVAGTPLFQAAGWVEPRPTSIRVAALAPGVVEKLLVVQDQLVEENEPVAELVKEDAELAYEAACSDLKLREAELQLAKATLAAAVTRFEQPVHLEAPLNDAQAMLAKVETQLTSLPFEIKAAEARLRFAAIDRDRKRKLVATDAIDQRAADLAESEYDTALAVLAELRRREASLISERDALTARRNSLQTRLELKADELQARDEAQANVMAAEARVRQAQIARDEAKLRLDRMTVRAPVRGRILSLIADPGSRLSNGMGLVAGRDESTVVTMYRPDSLQVRVDVRFEDLPKVSLAQPVQIRSPAVPHPLAGEVLFISSEADIQKNTLQVKVAIDDPPSVFKPDMLVDVTFLAPEPPESETAVEEVRLLVPRDAVHQETDGAYVWLVDQSAGTAKKVPVETGAVTGDGEVQVLKGLNLSSRLIVSGVEGLRDGDRVRISGEATQVTASSGETSSAGRLPSRYPQAGEH